MNPNDQPQKEPSKPSAAVSAVNSRIDQRIVSAAKKAGKAASKAVDTAVTSAAASTGILAPIAKPLGMIAGKISGWLTTKLAVFTTRHKGKVLGGLAVGLGLPALFIIGGVGVIPALAIGGGSLLVAGIAVAFGGLILGGLLTSFVSIFAIITIFTAFAMYIITASGMIVPLSTGFNGADTGASSAVATPVTNVESQYIKVTKTPDRPGPFQNSDLPLTITYTITVTAKTSPLTNIKFDNQCLATRKVAAAPGGPAGSSTVTCPQPVPDTVPTEIVPGKPFTWSYTATYPFPDYADSFIVDTFKVTATAVGKQTTAQGGAGIKIGNPPENCPSGWPLPGTPHVGQGPYTAFGNSHYGYEALDLSAVVGTKVTATNGGIAHVISFGNRSYGTHVRISSICQGKEYVSLYAHLSGVSVADGQAVVKGQEVGLSGGRPGLDGNTSAPHLHYEFRPVNPLTGDGGIWPRENQPLHMQQPWVPYQ